MSFTDGKTWVATEEDCHHPWSSGRDGKFFRCALCGYKFKPGDKVRWQYTNDIPEAYGNPLVCERCDGPDIIDRWRKMHQEVKERFWWFSRGRAE